MDSSAPSAQERLRARLQGGNRSNSTNSAPHSHSHVHTHGMHGHGHGLGGGGHHGDVSRKPLGPRGFTSRS